MTKISATSLYLWTLNLHTPRRGAFFRYTFIADKERKRCSFNRRQRLWRSTIGAIDHIENRPPALHLYLFPIKIRQPAIPIFKFNFSIPPPCSSHIIHYTDPST